MLIRLGCTQFILLKKEKKVKKHDDFYSFNGISSCIFTKKYMVKCTNVNFKLSWIV